MTEPATPPPQAEPAPSPAPPPAAPPASAGGWRPPAKSWRAIVLIIALAVTAILLVLYGWRLPPFAGLREETDNAYVRGRVTIIAPQVSGYVIDVPVRDFNEVKAGQVLARIDDRIYRARVEQARANVGAQEAALSNSTQAQRSRETATLSQDAAIANARAQLDKARADMRRADALIADGSISARERDQTLAALRAAEAGVRQAVAGRAIGTQDVRTVMVGRGGLEASVEAARAQLRLAEIDLGYTVIRAPEDGQLSEVGVRRGAFVTGGTQLMFLVPHDVWVIANFKEAQTRDMRVGQRASFRVDALGGARLKGHIQSISPATGSEYAVIKPDNATGNFVKVPQRLAVRVHVDPDQPLARRLRPGMSVEISIDTGSLWR